MLEGVVLLLPVAQPFEPVEDRFMEAPSRQPREGVAFVGPRPDSVHSLVGIDVQHSRNRVALSKGIRPAEYSLLQGPAFAAFGKTMRIQCPVAGLIPPRIRFAGVEHAHLQSAQWEQQFDE